MDVRILILIAPQFFYVLIFFIRPLVLVRSKTIVSIELLSKQFIMKVNL